jgi:hypothetical protein
MAPPVCPFALVLNVDHTPITYTSPGILIAAGAGGALFISITLQLASTGNLDSKSLI